MCASERSDQSADLLELIRRRLAARTRRVLDDASQRRAAVLVPLLRERGELAVLFTRRTETVEHHKGQIALPGGARDPEDAGLLETALRETEEELGLRRDLVTILGALDDVATVVSGFIITPFVGVIPTPVPLRVNPQEIAEVLTVPLAVFRDPSRVRVETRTGPSGEQVEVVFYDHGPHVIWGATARIMQDFIEAAFGEEGP
ncbi:MAG TPA: CoA pyrophosphatase [bacterium]|nr:CoA pyrophosphatase [bacterium]